MVSSALIEREDTDVGGNNTRADLRNNKSEREADCCAGLQMEGGRLEREDWEKAGRIESWSFG